MQTAAQIMDRARRAFAAALVTIVDLFNPTRIVVGGGIAIGQGDRLLDPRAKQSSAWPSAVRPRASRSYPLSWAMTWG